MNLVEYTLYVNEKIHRMKSEYSYSLLVDYAKFLSKKLDWRMFVGEQSLFKNFAINYESKKQISLKKTNSGYTGSVLTFYIQDNTCNSDTTGEYSLIWFSKIMDVITYFKLEPTQLFLDLLNVRNLADYNCC
ncbi:MAG: hypothetical protein GY849_02685 [Deltaproteobacteria bacterium]|nr:hypothetical protein [Deltaproteobacteria bacterium]